MIPNSRDTFKWFCLRRLGHPVIQHHLNEDQIDDCVDLALKYYADYNFDGSEKIYYTYQLTQTDINNRYITLPANIIGAVDIYNSQTIFQGSGMFNIQYQFMIANISDISSLEIAPYYSTMQNLQFLDEVLNGQKPFRYNRNNNLFYIDTDWSQYYVGMYLLVECYQVIDPNVYTNVWGDRWLQDYCVALLRKEQGVILKKYGGMKLPGGLEFNGQQIYDDAANDQLALEQKMLESFSLPILDFMA